MGTLNDLLNSSLPKLKFPNKKEEETSCSIDTTGTTALKRPEIMERIAKTDREKERRIYTRLFF